MGEIENLTKPLRKSFYKYLHISNRVGYILIIVRALTISYIQCLRFYFLQLIYIYKLSVCGLFNYCKAGSKLINEEIYIMYENQRRFFVILKRYHPLLLGVHIGKLVFNFPNLISSRISIKIIGNKFYVFFQLSVISIM